MVKKDFNIHCDFDLKVKTTHIFSDNNLASNYVPSLILVLTETSCKHFSGSSEMGKFGQFGTGRIYI